MKGKEVEKGGLKEVAVKVREEEVRGEEVRGEEVEVMER